MPDVLDNLKVQERLLGCSSIRIDSVIIILPPDNIAYIPDCRFVLENENERYVELARKEQREWEAIWGFYSKTRFAEPHSGGREWEVEIEHYVEQ